MNQPEREKPVYWFILLEKAVLIGDSKEAARAKSELERLGVSVAFRKSKPKKGHQRRMKVNENS